MTLLPTSLVARLAVAAMTGLLLTSCAGSSVGPTGSESAAPSPSATVEPTASPTATATLAGTASCADVFDPTDGRVVMTFGRFGHAYGIATIDADGSDRRQIVEPGPERDQPNDGTEGPRWTPDGRLLFDSNRAGGPDDWHIFVVNADGSALVQLTGGDDGIEWNADMSPDGSTLVYAKALSTPDGPAPFGGGGIFASDADGSSERLLAAVPEGVTPEFPEGAQDEWVDISPDGTRVAFTRGGTQQGGILIVSIDGTGLTRLVDVDFQPIRPRWSPDGQWIVFHSNGHRFETESSNVWIIHPDGSGLRQLTSESVPGQAWAADWSADGEHIVFVHTTRSRATWLDVMGLDGTPTCILWQGIGPQAGWDPDWGPPAGS
jgi:Tol biopolymer transport system component